MIFSELYSAYYNTVAKIIKVAINRQPSKKELYKIIKEKAFGESAINIERALAEEKWPIITKDGVTNIKHTPKMPLTIAQKRWLKAISLDPRIKLFSDMAIDFGDVTPLFTQEDICIFDRYDDGDNYTDEKYIKNFRMILDAIKNNYPLNIYIKSRKEKTIQMIVLPKYIEYSEKDDKFRLFGFGLKFGGTVNIGRIIKCERYTIKDGDRFMKRIPPRVRNVTFEVTDERNTMERALLHFAHFKKQAERLDDIKYKVTVSYDKDDETEILIRILSFGPMIKVTQPEHFKNLITERLKKQKSCEL